MCVCVCVCITTTALQLLLTLYGVDGQLGFPSSTQRLGNKLGRTVGVVETLRRTLAVVQLNVNLRPGDTSANARAANNTPV